METVSYSQFAINLGKHLKNLAEAPNGIKVTKSGYRLTPAATIRFRAQQPGENLNGHRKLTGSLTAIKKQLSAAFDAVASTPNAKRVVMPEGSDIVGVIELDEASPR